MHITRQLTLLHYELRIMNPLLFALPFVAALSLGGLGLWLTMRGAMSHDNISSLLVASLEGCVPLTVGVIASTLAAHDNTLELQLTLLTPYRVTAFRRFALIVIWTALVEVVASLALSAILPWALPNPFIKTPLVWLPPLLWLAALGILLALLMRSRSASSTVLSVLWVCQLAFHTYFATNGWTQPWFLFATLYTPDASFWLSNRIELVITAFIVFIVIWRYLRNAEWRFRAEDV